MSESWFFQPTHRLYYHGDIFHPFGALASSPARSLAGAAKLCCGGGRMRIAQRNGGECVGCAGFSAIAGRAVAGRPESKSLFASERACVCVGRTRLGLCERAAVLRRPTRKDDALQSGAGARQQQRQPRSGR